MPGAQHIMPQQHIVPWAQPRPMLALQQIDPAERQLVPQQTAFGPQQRLPLLQVLPGQCPPGTQPRGPDSIRVNGAPASNGGCEPIQ
mmetsp:Transcript_26684/g.70453  ORF Transcript_26684/g.70453 Transcript_26684/m.70453 type:complete len:87 (+) Transcript_26684:230-490(+)